MTNEAASPGADPTVAPEDPAERRRRLREGLAVWALAFVVLMVARYLVGPFVPWVAGNLKTVAVLLFLYVPGWILWRRHEAFADYGLTLRRWRTDLALYAKLSLAVFPAFVLLFWGFVAVAAHVPEPLRSWLSPYGPGFHPHFHLPPSFAYLVLTHLFVVALPEEFFYRGFVYARLAAGLDEAHRGRRLLGVVVGPAFWLTAVLFAVGHLTEPYPWRLAVFFPALLFMWLRLKSGTVLGSTLFHATSNIVVAVLEASFFPH